MCRDAVWATGLSRSPHFQFTHTVWKCLWPVSCSLLKIYLPTLAKDLTAPDATAQHTTMLLHYSAINMTPGTVGRAKWFRLLPTGAYPSLKSKWFCGTCRQPLHPGQLALALIPRYGFQTFTLLTANCCCFRPSTTYLEKIFAPCKTPFDGSIHSANFEDLDKCTMYKTDRPSTDGGAMLLVP